MFCLYEEDGMSGSPFNTNLMCSNMDYNFITYTCAREPSAFSTYIYIIYKSSQYHYISIYGT